MYFHLQFTFAAHGYRGTSMFGVPIPHVWLPHQQTTGRAYMNVQITPTQLCIHLYLISVTVL